MSGLVSFTNILLEKTHFGKDFLTLSSDKVTIVSEIYTTLSEKAH